MYRRTHLYPALLLLAACQSSGRIFEPVRARSMSEAGSVHVSVLSVAPWSEYARALQPEFDLSMQDAFGLVIQDGRWMTEGSRTQAGVGRETLVLDESQQALGSPSKLMPEEPGEGHAGPDPRAFEAIDGAGVRDPVLRFTAATALYQEVQMLNRYIRDVAVPNGYRPYMVRLQVGLMPNRRHAPYDAYTTLSFFIPGDRGTASLGLPLPLSTQDEIFGEPFGNAPKVLPVVVTDNLEASVKSKSIENVRQLLYTLGEFSSSFVDQFDTGLIQDAIFDEVHGRDLNSLFTVSRLSENTLRIRMGAMQEATSSFAMIPRNHHVTLLLMVPEGSPPLMEAVAKTELVDAETGKPLPAHDVRADEEARRELREAWDLVDDGVLDELLAHAEFNDQSGFSRLVKTELAPDHPARRRERTLWIDLIQHTVGDPYESSLFELPGQGEDFEESSRIFAEQIVVAEDDEMRTTITLREARVPDFEQILAVLRVTGGGVPDVVFPADLVTLDASRRMLHVEFPSFQRLKLDEDLPAGSVPFEPVEDADPDPRRLEFELRWAGADVSFPVLYRQVSPYEYLEPDLQNYTYND